MSSAGGGTPPGRPGSHGWRGRATALFVALVVSGLGGVAFAPSAGALSGAWEPTSSPLDAPRSLHTATVLDDGTVLIAGGIGDEPALSSVELYDPGTGEWSAGPDLGQARSGHTATLIADGRVLVTGGIDDTGAYLASAEIYDPERQTWELTDPLATARERHTASVLDDGRVLVVGGRNAVTTGNKKGGGVSLASAELYDPATGAWVDGVPAMSVGRDSHTATVLESGEVLVVGGYKGTSFDEDGGETLAGPELFDPQAGAGSGAWLAVSDPESHFHRTGHSAVLLDDGRVLIAGGQTGNIVTGNPPADSAELFDPAGTAEGADGRGSWSQTAPLIEGRNQHAAALLPGGRVLVAGGFGAAGEPLTSAEVYDLHAATWSPADPMTEGPRSLHVATPLDDGRVLVTGGATAFFGGNPLDSAQLFTPAPSVSDVAPDRGPRPGGTTVTITGTGLDRATAVAFGTVPATSFTVVSPTQLTAASPPGAVGVVDVTITSAAGTSVARPESTFTYTTVSPDPGAAGDPGDDPGDGGAGDGGAGGGDPEGAADPVGGGDDTTAPGDDGTEGDISDDGASEGTATPVADTGSTRAPTGQPASRSGALAGTGLEVASLVERALLCLAAGALLLVSRRVWPGRTKDLG